MFSTITGSAFRFIRDGEVKTTIPARTLGGPKSLGKIIVINGNLALKKCKVLMQSSYYWSDRVGGKWKPLVGRSNDKLFEIVTTKNDVTLQVSQSYLFSKKTCLPDY